MWGAAIVYPKTLKHQASSIKSGMRTSDLIFAGASGCSHGASQRQRSAQEIVRRPPLKDAGSHT